VIDLLLLWWLCTTSGDCVSLDSSCVILQWLCTTGSDCMSLNNSCVLLVVVVYYYGSTQLCSIGWHCSRFMLLVDCHGEYQVIWSNCVLLDRRYCDR
jgi:hypothetical protein